ncbi:23066_t:CDS:2, partial [Gigaspora margarita]
EPKKQKHNKENETPTKRKSLTGAQKAEICHLKQKEKVLALWVSRVTIAQQTVTGVIIQHKAVQLAEGLDVRQGEATSVPLKDLFRFHNELHKIIKKYKPKDVYNANETALYWHMEPDKKFAKSGESSKPLNIRDLIDFTATAWKKSLIGQLPLDQPMNVYEYITADNNLIITEIPTDEKIIEAIRNQNCIEPEDENSKKLISFVQALEFINRILLFLEQQPDSNFKVENSLIRELGKLKK